MAHNTGLVTGNTAGKMDSDPRSDMETEVDLDGGSQEVLCSEEVHLTKEERAAEMMDHLTSHTGATMSIKKEVVTALPEEPEVQSVPLRPVLDQEPSLAVSQPSAGVPQPDLCSGEEKVSTIAGDCSITENAVECLLSGPTPDEESEDLVIEEEYDPEVSIDEPEIPEIPDCIPGEPEIPEKTEPGVPEEVTSVTEDTSVTFEESAVTLVSPEEVAVPSEEPEVTSFTPEVPAVTPEETPVTSVTQQIPVVTSVTQEEPVVTSVIQEEPLVTSAIIPEETLVTSAEPVVTSEPVKEPEVTPERAEVTPVTSVSEEDPEVSIVAPESEQLEVTAVTQTVTPTIPSVATSEVTMVTSGSLLRPAETLPSVTLLSELPRQSHDVFTTQSAITREIRALSPPVPGTPTAPVAPFSTHQTLPPVVASSTLSPKPVASSTALNASSKSTSSTSTSSAIEHTSGKKRKAEKPFEPGIIWIKPEPIDPDEPQVIPPPQPHKRRNVEGPPPNVVATSAPSAVKSKDVQAQLQKLLQNSTSQHLLASLLSQLPQNLTSSLLAKVLAQQQQQQQQQQPEQGPSVATQRTVPTSQQPQRATQGGQNLADRFPPLPQVSQVSKRPRQISPAPNKHSKARSPPAPYESPLQKTRQLLNESNQLQSKLSQLQSMTTPRGAVVSSAASTVPTHGSTVPTHKPIVPGNSEVARAPFVIPLSHITSLVGINQVGTAAQAPGRPTSTSDPHHALLSGQPSVILASGGTVDPNQGGQHAQLQGSLRNGNFVLQQQQQPSAGKGPVITGGVPKANVHPKRTVVAHTAVIPTAAAAAALPPTSHVNKQSQGSKTRPILPKGTLAPSHSAAGVICINDSDDENGGGGDSDKRDTTQTAARCRPYQRDEHKINIIFEMMKRKCNKEAGEGGGGELDGKIGTPTPTPPPPPTQGSGKESIITSKDLHPIKDVSGKLQCYLVRGSGPFILTPLHGPQPDLFTVQQTGNTPPCLRGHNFTAGTVLNLKNALSSGGPTAPTLTAQPMPIVTNPASTPAPINISTSTVINYQPVFLNQQPGGGGNGGGGGAAGGASTGTPPTVYTSNQQPLNSEGWRMAAAGSGDSGVQYVLLDNKGKVRMKANNRDIVWHNVSFTTADNGNATVIDWSHPSQDGKKVAQHQQHQQQQQQQQIQQQQQQLLQQQQQAGTARRYMTIAPAPIAPAPDNAARSNLAPRKDVVQFAPVRPILAPGKPAQQSVTVPYQQAAGTPTGIALQRVQNVMNIQQAQRQGTVIQQAPPTAPTAPPAAAAPQVVALQPNHLIASSQQTLLQQRQGVVGQQQQQQQQQPLPVQQQPGGAGQQRVTDASKDREARLKMVMNSLSQILKLPSEQQKSVIQNNPILRELSMKKKKEVAGSAAGPAPQQQMPQQHQAQQYQQQTPVVVKVPVPPMQQQVSNNKAPQRVILPKPAPHQQQQQPRGYVPAPQPTPTAPAAGAAAPGYTQSHLRALMEQKIERDAHEKWVGLSDSDRQRILAAAKEKVSTLNNANLTLLLNASYQHMYKVPLDMRKALLIAAQERMEKLSGVQSAGAAGGASRQPQQHHQQITSVTANKPDDDLMIVNEVPSRESRTKVTIRDETGEIVTLMGRPAEFLPRTESRYGQEWREHFSGCARTRPIIKTKGLPTKELPDNSAWRECNRGGVLPSVSGSCARVRPYHRAVGTKVRLKRTGGSAEKENKKIPVRGELLKIVTRLKKVNCSLGRGTRTSLLSSKELPLTNVFTLTDEGLDDIAEALLKVNKPTVKRLGETRSVRARQKDIAKLKSEQKATTSSGGGTGVTVKMGAAPTAAAVAPSSAGEMPKVTVCRSSGETPLHRSAQQGWLELVRQCLEAGEDVNVRDNAGWTPLHEACAKRRVEVVQLLLDRGADANVGSTTTGVRPLHDACLYDYTDIAEMLLKAGADPKLPTFRGKCPLDLSRTSAMRELINRYIAELDGGRPVTRSWSRACTLELSDLPHLPVYKLALDGEEEKDYYLLTDLIARLNISRSTFSMNYPAFQTQRMRWKEFARLLGKSPYFVPPERLPSSICEFIEVSENANRILNIRSETFEFET